MLSSTCHGEEGAIRPTRNADAVRRHEQPGVEPDPEEFISHAEVIEWLERGGYIRFAVLEELPSEDRGHRFAVLLLTSWRNGYYPFAVNPQRESTYRDLHRLLEMLRSEFSYPGSIEIRQPDAPKKRKGSWTRTSPIAKGQKDA